MQLNNKKEEFSKAYLNAVAAVCGWTMGSWSQDQHKIDCSLSKKKTNPITGKNSVIEIDFQLKCTSAPTTDNTDFISFTLEKNDFEQLSNRVGGKSMMLVVMVVPDDSNHWFTLEDLVDQELHRSTKLKYCSYLAFISDEAGNYLNDDRTIRFYKGRHEFTTSALTEIENKLGDPEYRKSILLKELERLEGET